MAHNYKIISRRHTNKDGSPSKTRRDWLVEDRTRAGRSLVGVATSEKGAKELIEADRVQKITQHLLKHPNDEAFRRKHGIEEVSK